MISDEQWERAMEEGRRTAETLGIPLIDSGVLAVRCRHGVLMLDQCQACADA